MNLNTELNQLKGVGKIVERQLEANDLKTTEDLIYYLPRKYNDYSHITLIAVMRPGPVSIKVSLINIKSRRARRGIHITEAEAVDETGKVKIIWFNQPYRVQSIKTNKKYYLSGEFGLQRQRLQIINPSTELADTEELTHTARILPTYRESRGVSTVLIRKLIKQVFAVIDELPEILPGWMIKKYDLLPYAVAVRQIHFPDTKEKLEQAKKRLGFDELFVLIMASQTIREQNQAVKSISIPFERQSAADFVKHLPFKLTDSQRRCVWQIYKSMESQKPMNMLVEGDVGSGKTVVATMASLMVVRAELQVAFVAPTELLACQHSKTIAKLFHYNDIKGGVALLTSSVKSKQKQEIRKRLKNKEISILVGTHALFQEDVDWHKLGLVIIDEQHRFGVQQRQKLLVKAEHMPHVLCLTATPIPRSLALTVYGELDVGVLDQTPSSRAGVDTFIVSPNSTLQMYKAVKAQLDKGRQAYVVCPLIAETEKLQAASVETIYKQLKQKELKGYKVGYLHGKLKPDKKEKIMEAFVERKIDILVSTTVIEVGVDISNATVMIIVGADRFGLAQLHQLRGRVGRAEHKGYCYLVMSDSSAPSSRVQAIKNSNDGFKLAELDLEIRGPGAIYGTRQHGILDLKIAKLTDVKLINLTKQATKEFKNKGEGLVQYKQIANRVDLATKLTYLN